MMRKNKISLLHARQIRIAYESEMISAYELAKKWNCSPQTIYTAIRRAGGRVKRNWQRHSIKKVQKKFPGVRKIRLGHRPGGARPTEWQISCPKCKKLNWLDSCTVRSQLKRGLLIGQCRHCSFFKGGYIRRDGYRQIHINGKLRMEHDVVMEKHLGRKLRPGETVHHGPGGRADNRIKNLQLRKKGDHPTGLSEDDIVNWLRGIGYSVRKSKKALRRFHEKATWA